jgi:hypothetical protein
MGAFWNNAVIEPKRTHRFLVEFFLPNGDTTQMFARSCSKPGYEVGQSEIKFLGQSYYYPGAVTWADVSVSFINPQDPDFDKQLQDLLSLMGWVNPDAVAVDTSVANGGTISKALAVGELGRILIKELDGDGTTIGHYVLNNAWIRSVSYGGLDYSSEELSTVDITFRYDWAVYNQGEPMLSSP